jgi:hypothetical protein
MAIKDWKETGRIPDGHLLRWEKKKDEDSSIQIYHDNFTSNKPIQDLGWTVQIWSKSKQNWVTKRKHLSKPQALRFAKAYMRKH